MYYKEKEKSICKVIQNIRNNVIVFSFAARLSEDQFWVILREQLSKLLLTIHFTCFLPERYWKPHSELGLEE